MPARFGTNAPMLDLDTTNRVKNVHRKWKDAKDVCISFHEGSLKIALFVKTIPIVADMLMAVHIRNDPRFEDPAFVGGGTASDFLTCSASR